MLGDYSRCCSIIIIIIINITSIATEFGSAKKIINHIQVTGTYRGHHQFEGQPTI